MIILNLMIKILRAKNKKIDNLYSLCSYSLKISDINDDDKYIRNGTFIQNFEISKTSSKLNS